MTTAVTGLDSFCGGRGPEGAPPPSRARARPQATQLAFDDQGFIDGVKERVEQGGIEVFPAALAHDVEGLLDRKGGFIDALGRQGVEGVGDRGDPPFERNRVAGQAARVAGAVEFLVVRPGDHRRQFQQLRLRPIENMAAHLGMPRDGRKLLRGEFSGLEQDMIGGAYFPDVVHGAGNLDQLAPVCVQPVPAGQQGTIEAHATQVLGGVRVPELRGERQTLDRFLP